MHGSEIFKMRKVDDNRGRKFYYFILKFLAQEPILYIIFLMAFYIEKIIFYDRSMLWKAGQPGLRQWSPGHESGTSQSTAAGGIPQSPATEYSPGRQHRDGDSGRGK